jgi:hypothetical protein
VQELTAQGPTTFKSQKNPLPSNITPHGPINTSYIT